MAVLTCATDSILNPAICNDRGGIREAYWFEYDKVDWDAMVADPLQFDVSNHQVLGYTMIGGATMSPLTFIRKSAYYEFTYEREADVYSILVQWIFKAKENSRRVSLQKAIACCNLGLHLYMNDNTQRVIGPDFNGESIEEMVEGLAVGRHLDASGQMGTSRARDEMDLIGESFYAPLFADVPKANLPLA